MSVSTIVCFCTFAADIVAVLDAVIECDGVTVLERVGEYDCVSFCDGDTVLDAVTVDERVSVCDTVNVCDAFLVVDWTRTVDDVFEFVFVYDNVGDFVSDETDATDPVDVRVRVIVFVGDCVYD